MSAAFFWAARKAELAQSHRPTRNLRLYYNRQLKSSGTSYNGRQLRVGTNHLRARLLRPVSEGARWVLYLKTWTCPPFCSKQPHELPGPASLRGYFFFLCNNIAGSSTLGLAEKPSHVHKLHQSLSLGQLRCIYFKQQQATNHQVESLRHINQRGILVNSCCLSILITRISTSGHSLW